MVICINNLEIREYETKIDKLIDEIHELRDERVDLKREIKYLEKELDNANDRDDRY
jgi:predicted  nucleic acid-binding Zn-ribbon protein